MRRPAYAIALLAVAGLARLDAQSTSARTLHGTACLVEVGVPRRCIDGIQVTAIQLANKWVLRPKLTKPKGKFDFNQFGIDTKVLLKARYEIGGKLYSGEFRTVAQVAPMQDVSVEDPPLPVEIVLGVRIDINRVPPAGGSWQSDSDSGEPLLADPVSSDFETLLVGNAPLAGATVTLVEAGGEGLWSAITDDHGKARLMLETGRKYTAIYTAPGYEVTTRLLEWTPAGWMTYAAGNQWEKAGTVRLAREASALAETGAPSEEELYTARRANFNASVIRALPLAMVRSVDAFALLEPGVAPAPDAAGRAGPGIGPGVGTAGQFSTNGLRSRENSFTIDGADNNDEDTGVRRQGYFVPLAQAIEGLEIFQIFTAAPDARFGRTIGAQVNIVSRAATDQLHGSLFGFVSDSRWNARDYFAPADNPKAPFTMWQSGAALGGPVGRHGSFLYSSAEHIRRRAETFQHFATPSAADRGLFGRGAVGLANSLYPSSLAGNAVFSLFPFPNNVIGPYGANTYTVRLPADADGTLYSVRFDQWLGRKRDFWLMFRFNGVNEKTTLPSTGRAMDSSLRPETDTQNFVTVLSNDIVPSLANNFRVSFGHTATDFVPLASRRLLPSRLFPDQPMLLNAPLVMNLSRNGQTRFDRIQFGGDLAGVDQSEQLIGAVGEMRIVGFSPIGVDSYRFPQDRNQRTWQFSDLVTWVRGRNTFQAGFDMRRFSFASNSARNSRPLVQFNGMQNQLPAHLALSASLSPLDNVAAGAPAGVFQTVGVTDDFSLSLRRTAADVFFNNEFRWSSRFLITTGLRLEFNRLPSDLDDRLSLSYTPDQFRVEAGRAREACAPSPLSLRVCQLLVENLFTESSRDLERVFGEERIGLDPRIGFAWDLVGSRKTVLRAAAGIYTGQFVPVVINESRSSFPTFASINVARPVATSTGRVYMFNLASDLNSALRRPGSISTVRSGAASAPNLLALLGNFVFQPVDPSTGRLLDQVLSELVLNQTEPAPGLKNPYSYHFHLSLDQQLSETMSLTAAYVGTQGRNLLRASTPYGGPLRNVFNAQSVFEIGASFPEVIGLYAPVEQDLTKPPTRPLWYEGASTSSYNSLQLNFRWLRRRGPQLRSAFTWSHTIDDASDFFDTANGPALPQNSRNRSERGDAAFDIRLRSVTHWVWDFTRRRNAPWFAGAQWSGILTMQTGQPFTTNTVYDWNADGNLTDRLDQTAALAQSEDRRIRVVLPASVDPKSLLAARGASGRVGRNTFRADGMISLDSAITMPVYTAERWRLALRAEGFNLLNRAQFGIPVRWLEAPAFGQSAYTTAPNRTLQFAVKIEF